MINPPNLKDILLNKNNQFIEFSSNQIINELKVNAVDKLINCMSDKVKGKKLNIFLKNLKKIIDELIKTMIEDENTKNIKDKKTINALLAQLYVTNELITTSLFEYSKNKNFNFIKFLNNVKKDCKNLNNKDDIEDDSSYESSDDESNKRKRSNKTPAAPKKKSKVIEESEEEYDDDDDDDDDDYIDVKNQMNLRKNKNKEFFEEFMKSSINDTNNYICNYFSELQKEKKDDVLEKLKEINTFQKSNEPLLFKLLYMNLPIQQKSHVLKKYLGYITSRGESNKLKGWIDAVTTIPFGKFLGVDLKSIKQYKIKQFLDNLQKTMDTAVWGHNEAKRHIIQIMGQQFRNPESKGNMIGIYGPPGNGKSSLVKEGIAKAMGKPFVFISLGGATDASFLDGHSYTYEGSIYGRIAQGIIESKCMDPIIYFDELDKISKTYKGDEITNLLIHLTDPVQNSHFRDKYFHGLEFDLSKVTFIFSYNDPSLVDRVLMDRITQIETKFLLLNQKIHIAQNYLLPGINKDIGFTNTSVKISNEIIEYIITKYTNEGGVRKLKSLLYNIMRELNIANLTKTKINNTNIIFPFELTKSVVNIILKDKNEIESETIHKVDKCGVINGMYATTNGVGGILPIEILWAPSTNPYDIKATGNLQHVIKESTQVASTLAFNYIDKELQEKYLKEWKERPKGLHIHCPDGSVPKDGPSAGTALSVAIYSILTNKKIKHDVAITGEINLQAQVTAIGGLENKLEGAKKAGVKLALFPKENQKDIDKIKERNPKLIDENFKVQVIETFDEAIKYSIEN